MELRVLCVVFVLIQCCQAWKTEYTAKGQEEGEECDKQADEVWTCKKGSECEGLQDILKQNGRLKTCSWQGQTPILCCPPKKKSEPLTNAKSQEKCAEYEKLLCNDEDVFIFSAQAQPLAALERKKRQDLNGQNVETTLDTTPVFAVAGGRLTKPGEFLSAHLRAVQWKKRQSSVEPDEEATPFPVYPIFGGIPTQPTEFSSMALIGYGDPGAISWQCGGSLISETFVLSAAHCVNTPYGLARWARLGDLDLQTDREEARPQQIEIVERVTHPGYKAPAFYNDIVLFRLARPVQFDRYVRPTCLHPDTQDPTGAGTAAGWGKTESSGPRSSALMQVDISFVPVERCKQIVGVVDKYLPNGVDTATMICAGELGKDTCQGDSGGPLILPPKPWLDHYCLARLVGVTSFGPKNCGVTSVPGAYVRVAHFIPWIESIVWPEINKNNNTI